MKALKKVFLMTRPTETWCNILQTLQRRTKNNGTILPDEHTC